MVIEKSEWRKIDPKCICLKTDVIITWKTVTMFLARILHEEGEDIEKIQEKEFWLGPDSELEIRVQAGDIIQTMYVPDNGWDWISSD